MNEFLIFSVLIPFGLLVAAFAAWIAGSYVQSAWDRLRGIKSGEEMAAEIEKLSREYLANHLTDNEQAGMVHKPSEIIG